MPKQPNAPAEISCGTVRFVPRSGFTAPGGGERILAPLVGYLVTPMPDGAPLDACIEVRLLSNGTASWRVVKEGVLLSGHPNAVQMVEGGQRDYAGKDFNALYRESVVGWACFPDVWRPYREEEGGP